MKVQKTNSNQQVEPKKEVAQEAVPVRVAQVEWPQKEQNQPQKAEKKKKVINEPQPKTDTAGKGGEASQGQWQIVGTFACDVGFYIEQMSIRGAKLVLYDRRSKDFFSLSLKGDPARMSGLPAHYSQVTRRITADHPQAGSILRRASQVLGPGRYEILLLMPKQLETMIKDGITSLIANSGQVEKKKIMSVIVRYRNEGSRLAIEVDKVVFKESQSQVNQSFVL